jgi:hypothetical protein
VGSEEPVRLGGRLRLPTGEVVVWSIADGRRGRRWREVASGPDGVARTVLAETDPTGRLVRLEIASAAGLLTLHPDEDGTVLHGNVVGPDGIRHLSFDRTTLLVVGSPASVAILTGWLAREIGIGETRSVDLVRIDDRLEPRPATWGASRVDERTWRLDPAEPGVGPGEGSGVADGGGLVRLERDGRLVVLDAWVGPLEREPDTGAVDGAWTTPSDRGPGR